jgi:anti-sigma regulatory factor (Ser/Thr protein kinase)
MVGTVQDITEENRAEREHRIAEALQRSLLPASLPTIPGVAMAARYVAATTEMEIGGDWYDVVQLPHGRVGVAIGDVAGHGLAATSTMGQLRMGLRAYALDYPSPAEVVRRLHLLAQTMQVAELATLLYLVLDPGSESISFASAGHIPPLVIRSGGEAEYIDGRHGPPIGAAEHAEQYEEDEVRLEPGSTLVLFTDGLIERRGSSLREGLDRLREVATGAAPDVDALCTRLVSSMLGEDVSDDVALLAIRPVSFDGSPLEVRFPAEPRALASLRHAMRRWLGQMQISTEDAEEVLVACGEACANAIVHAYGGGEGEIRLELALYGDEVELTVADTGRWRERNTTEGGRGIPLMKGFMDSVQFQSGPEGTSVRMRRKLRDRVRS